MITKTKWIQFLREHTDVWLDTILHTSQYTLIQFLWPVHLYTFLVPIYITLAQHLFPLVNRLSLRTDRGKLYGFECLPAPRLLDRLTGGARSLSSDSESSDDSLLLLDKLLSRGDASIEIVISLSPGDEDSLSGVRSFAMAKSWGMTVFGHSRISPRFTTFWSPVPSAALMVYTESSLCVTMYPCGPKESWIFLLPITLLSRTYTLSPTGMACAFADLS